MRIRYLLLHAYGTGGTIRTVINQANTLVAAGHDIELVSAVRHKDEPWFPVDPRVKITSLTDSRASAVPEEPRGLLATRRRRQEEKWKETPPAHVPKGEFGVRYFNRYLEKVIERYLRGLQDGILVSTRPALNILTAKYATKGVVRVAQEHMNLSVHRPDVQEAIKRHYPRFDAVAVLTQRDREEYGRLLPGVRLLRIPNAVHSLDQEPSHYSNKVVLAAGRLFPQKGFDMLIPAWAKVTERHPDWQLRIFGTGERWQQLRDLIEEHHLYNHVFLMGHTQQLDDELAKASVYVLSSRFEGLPMVMIEAMAHALPVVSFDCPTGPADVITDGREGLLVPPKDVDGLADALCRLVEDRDLRARMGEAAVKTARDYAPEAVHPQWEILFSELLAAHGGTRGKVEA
jgi:glycosyltransferase involved in cell wall biosynthesis